MLELKNLTKIYTTGSGETRAIDGVSTTFAETGLVFLLGKSGSGKSTMLNLVGGLDAPTSGELIVGGKSSKNFSESDFDSYRNTFVGFVFQEYNVLDEFTVEENVGLALELQGNTKNGDKVQKILDEVELHEFAKRKPNTLSGGQKQRVAIARALVKEPKIILADEPTGALDSETGTQVFETLKRLSKTRLVIVVSHDREFAETYGDRIVELKDGKIVADTYKTSGEASENVDGTTAQKEYDGEQTQFIRSRLPASKAIKMGASGLKLKPFRLILTIFLSVVSFVMFGLSSTMMLYDPDTVLLNSFLQSDCNYLIVEKHYEKRDTYGEDLVVTYPTAEFTPAEVLSYGEDAIGAFNVNVLLPDNISVPHTLSNYYKSEVINRVAVLPENHPLRQKLTGTYPVAANEVAVSSFFLEYAREGEFTRIDEEGNKLGIKSIHTAEDLIGEYVAVSTWNRIASVKITGVFDSGRMPTKFNVLKNHFAQERNRVLREEYDAFHNEGLFTLALASNAFVEAFIGSNKLAHTQYFDLAPQFYKSVSDAQATKDWGCISNGFKVYHKGMEPVRRIFWAVDGIEELASDELILPIDGGIASHYVAYAELYGSTPEFQEFHKYQQILMHGRYLNPNDSHYHIAATQEEIEAAPDVVTHYLKAHPFTVTFMVELRGSKVQVIGTFKVVGAYVNPDVNEPRGFYCSQALYTRAMAGIGDEHVTDTKYVREADAVYDSIIVPAEDEQVLRDTLGKIDKTDPATDVVYQLSNAVYRAATHANGIVAMLFTVFLWVGVVLALFAALLLFNFISMSISNKKKEIGILRAVGARGADVFKIFFSESGIIVGICIVLALFGTFIVTIVLNAFLKVNLGLPVALFAFRWISILLMLAVAAVVAFAGTFVPVYLAAKKKPVESIRAL